MSISVICPIYNGSRYIKDIDNNLKKQQGIDKIFIKYLLTESDDESESILQDISAEYVKIAKEDFSHSISRERAAYEAKGNIVVFITQDIIIEDDMWLHKLTKDIVNEKCEAAFSRQICTNKSIERYTRMFNYPEKSRIVSLDNISELGIRTFFYSDAASAIRKDIFIELNGYDNKDLVTNEDMYIAYKLITRGYRIKYCSDSQVIHSHKYSYKSLFKRYFDQGVFLKQHKYIQEAGDTKSAIDLLKFIINKSIEEKNISVLLQILPNFTVRYIANKLGNNYENLSIDKIHKFSGNTSYWRRNKK